MTIPLLTIADLVISFHNQARDVPVVNGISLSVFSGQTLAIVGESGCGKSLTALAVIGLAPPSARIERGEIRLNGRELLGCTPAELRTIRGREVAMIFQEPMTSLNPVFTIGEQLLEAIGLNGISNRREAEARAIAALHEVGISEPAQRLRQYPHEFSGGMRQRVMIAMALAGQPRLLLADEPTTALDVTVQAQILRLLRDIQQRRGMGIMFITHDLGIVAEHADVACVVFAGRVMEYASVSTLFARPRHPYTRALLECRPKLHDRPRRLMTVAHAMSNVNQIGIESGASAFLPWWPARASENSAREYCLMEVEPNHWVACFTSARHEITNRIPQIEPEPRVPSSLAIA